MELPEKDLIQKYISGKCTGDELIRVRAIMAKPGYTELFDEVLSEDGNPIVTSQEPVDFQMQNWTDMINSKLDQDRQNQSAPIIQKPYFFRYAAIWIIFALGASIWGLSYLKTSKEPLHIAYTEIVNPKGKRCRIVLSDSSTVFLGAGSKLRFPEQFTGNTREINLEGEAFFEITKNPERPFIIHTANVQTKVLGTSFKITAFKDQPISVGVVTGKVRVDRLIDHKLKSLAVLTPGQEVYYANETTENRKIEKDDLKEWKEGHLVHTEKPLSFIAEELERWYNVDIKISNADKAAMLMDINITANIPINKVMKILGKSGHFKYKITGNTITIF